MRTVAKIQGLFDLADGGGDCVNKSTLWELEQDGLATKVDRSFQRCTTNALELIDQLCKLYDETVRQNKEFPPGG